ncbi:MAG: Glu/Leu/Phe/Val dehydrogenase dimerization domain-containing protein, partial [Pseudomonadota bacterium]
PMGGGKGGANFDPTGRSDREIMRFCTAFMTELHRHIGPDIDVPAGDINVGAREIGYLFGAYRRITNEFEGALTGKGQSYGGSALRTEATGYGLLHFVTHMLNQQDDTVEGKRIVISGAGNVATYAAEKALALGATVVSLSDSDGTLRFDDGLDQNVIEDVRAIKAKGGSLEELADRSGAEWVSDTAPWGLACDVALPCATQNEMDGDGAKSLIDSGCKLIAEGANMPLTADAISRVNDAGVLFGPAKAANAGGVAVSGLEIAQNRTRESRSRDTISEQLEDVMASVHEQCVEHGKRDDGSVDYAKGANIAAFKKIADAMIGQGIS